MVSVPAATGYWDLTRPLNAVAAGVLAFIGAYVAGGIAPGSPTLWSAGAAVAATVLATAAGNAINDYFDRSIDRVNAPDRPIPRGAVTPRGALGFSAALFVGAVGLALTLPPLAIAIAGVNLVVLAAYTRAFKGRPGVGNAVVAYLVGSAFLFGGAAVGDVGAAAVLFALAALATFAREVVKDVEDRRGDAAEGLRTLPIAIGDRRSLWIGTGALGLALAASPLPYIDGTFGLPYLAVVVPADLAMAAGAYRAFSDPTAGQRRLKYGMFLATVAFVVGRLAA